MEVHGRPAVGTVIVGYKDHVLVGGEGRAVVKRVGRGAALQVAYALISAIYL